MKDKQRKISTTHIDTAEVLCIQFHYFKKYMSNHCRLLSSFIHEIFNYRNFFIPEQQQSYSSVHSLNNSLVPKNVIFASIIHLVEII